MSKKSDRELKEALENIEEEIEKEGLNSNLMSSDQPQPTKRKKGMTNKAKTKALKTNQAPRKNKETKKTSKKSSDKPEKKTEGYSARDLADSLGIVPGVLRKALRGIKAKKPGVSWIWGSKSQTKDLVPKIKAFLAEEKSSKPSKKGKKKVKKETEVATTSTKKKSKKKFKKKSKKDSE